MSTLCVFRVIASCCSGCRSKAMKALKKAYGVSVEFDMAEKKLIVEGDVDPAKIIEELQRKAKKVKVELVDGPRTVSNADNAAGGGGEGSSSQNAGNADNADNAGGGGGGSNADGARESSREEVNTSRNSSNGEEIQEETQGGNMGQTVPMDQNGPNVPVHQARPGYDMYPHYNPNGGYPQQPIYNMPQYDNMYGGYPQQPMDHYFSDENPNGCTVM